MNLPTAIRPATPTAHRHRERLWVAASLCATLGFLLICLTAVWWIFRTGYRLKN